MDKRHLLLARLDAIGRSLEQTGHGVALIGLGSVGNEIGRLDEYSDLDFFAIVERGFKSRFMDDLDWLSSIRPIAFCFRNTIDGYKLLFDDEVFCEFAVFEPEELNAIPFAPGRIVWKRPDVDPAISAPARPTAPPAPRPVEWLVGEALTNLYVGLCRHHRGERLSAARLIQNHALDRLLDLAPLIEAEAPGDRDVFAQERRFEQRYPALARRLPDFVQGYDRSLACAAAILSLLEQHFQVNATMARIVRGLLDDTR